MEKIYLITDDSIKNKIKDIENTSIMYNSDECIINNYKKILNEIESYKADYLIIDFTCIRYLLTKYKVDYIKTNLYRFFKELGKFINYNNIYLLNIYTINRYINSKGTLVYKEDYYSNECENINKVLRYLYKYIYTRFCKINIIEIPVDSMSNNVDLYLNNNLLLSDNCTEYIKNKILQGIKTNYIGSINVSISLVANKIRGSIIHDIEEEGYEYLFYLLRYGKVVQKTNWIKSSVHDFEVSSDGIYVIQGYIRYKNDKQIRFSKSIQYFLDETKRQFDKFMDEEPKVNKKLSFTPKIHKYTYPNKIFSVIQYNNRVYSDKYIKNNIFELDKDIVIKKYDFINSNNSVAVLCEDSLKSVNNIDYIFSGFMTFNSEFIYGDEDIHSEIDIETLKSENGQYTLLKADKNKIFICRDIFGLSRLYYYVDKDISVVSNNYHSLLLLVASLKIKLSINFEKAKLLLTMNSRLNVMSRNFTNDMDIKGVKELDLHSDIIIDKNGFRLENNEMHKLLSNETDLYSINYDLMLENAKHEILQNIKAVLKNNRFKNILVDLTGGLDSRVIYSALTNIDTRDKNIYINSMDVPNSDDLPIALQINGIYNYKYNNLDRINERLKIEDADSNMRSFYMGTHYYHNLLLFKSKVDAITLNGASGECITRPFYIINHFNTYADNLSFCGKEDKFTEYIFNKYSVFAITDFDGNNDMLRNTICNIPCYSLTEKFDKHYLYYGNSYHFNSIFRNSYGSEEWGPIQSKTLFALNRIISYQAKTSKLQYDIIYKMNPLISHIKYDYEKDNIDYKQNSISLIPQKELNTGAQIDLNYSDELWKNANNEKKVSFIKNSTEGQVYTSGQVSEILYENLMYNFYVLMKTQKDLKESIGIALYFYIKNNRNNSKEIRFIYNKITSLLDQQNIFINLNKNIKINKFIKIPNKLIKYRVGKI